jgi:hypothetical protein
VILETSNTAIGIANATERALQRSISGWIRGTARSLRNRRRSDSDAQRYCAGFRPIRANARRQAWISGSSLSGPAASLASATAWSAARRGPTSTCGLMRAAWSTTGTSSG